jgi:hypothetical protein
MAKVAVSAFYDEADVMSLCEFFGKDYNRDDYVFSNDDPIAVAIAQKNAKICNWQTKQVQHVTKWNEDEVKDMFKKNGMEYDPNRYTYKDALDYENSLKLGEGVKFDNEKVDWTLVPFKAMEPVVRVLEHGAKKYSADNWKIVKNARHRYLAAAYRHMNAINDGEWVDDKETGGSGEPHAAHVICCMLFLLWFDMVGYKDE